MQRALFVAALLCAVSESVLAGVSYRINNGTTVSLGETDVIAVGTLAGETLLEIFDDSGGVTASRVNRLVVRGAAVTGGSLKVQVAKAIAGDVFAFLNPGRFFAVGLRNFGGIRFENPANANDTSLRDRAVVAVAVAGNITGDIDAAQVFRIDALAYEDAQEVLQGGRIFGNITARGLNNSVLANESDAPEGQVPAIAYVRAGREISGTITATGTNAFNAQSRANYANIARVIVGPTDSAAGLQGDVRAEKGAIGSVFSSGPIGAVATGTTAARTPKIWAGDGIVEVLVVAEDQFGTLTFPPRLLRADIRADRSAYALAGATFREAGLSLVRTEGDLEGEIHAGNIMAEFSLTPIEPITGPPAASSTAQLGVYAKGVCRAPITIDHVCEGNMIAKSFTQPIVIGRMMEGAIIAWSGLGGEPQATPTLPSLRIGLDEPPDSPTGPATFAYDDKWSRGFTGQDNGCFPTLTAPNPANPDSVNPNVAGYYGRAGLCEPSEGPAASVIAANSAGTIALSHMTVFETERGYTPQVRYSYSHPAIATIECQRIGTLRIDDFREGAVWSGLFDDSGYEGDGQAVHGNTQTTDDYVQIDSVEIGCMGDAATLWARDISIPSANPETPPTIVPLDIHVAVDAHGAFHLPQLTAAGTLVIDGSLAAGGIAADAPCGCAPLGVCALTRAIANGYSNTPSPRDVAIRESALISILDPRGLKGRVVINAANAGGTWAGGASITVGSVSLSPNPAYAGSSLAYGGGVVGVVPFIHYQDDAFPMFLPAAPTYPTSGHGPKLPTVRAQDSTVDGAGRLRFTGQLAPATPAQVAAAAKVQKNVGGAWVLDTGWEITLADMPFSTVRKELRFRWTAGTASAPAGEYRVVYGEIPPATQGGTPTPLGHLLCAGLAPGAPPAAARVRVAV